MLDFSAPVQWLMLVLLALSLIYTLYRVKQRLIGTSHLRFTVVALLNIACYALLAGAIGKLSFEHPVDDMLTLVTDGEGKNHQDPSVLLLEHPGLNRLKVEGYGLFQSQWNSFDGVLVDFKPPVLPSGAIAVTWQRRLILGQELVIKGKWHSNSTSRIYTVKLLNPANEIIAQQRIVKGEQFELKTIPKANGRYSYRFIAEDDSGKRISDEPVPIQVVEAPRAKLMVIQSAPSFETRHLKNWASENGAAMLVLTTISKARYITDSVNLAPEQPKTLHPATLADFDLLLIDGRALTTLTSQQQLWLQQAVEQGLGLMVLLDNHLLEQAVLPKVLSDFELSKPPSEQKNEVVMSGSEVAFDVLPVLLEADSGKVFEQDMQGEPLGLYRRYGLGKVAVSKLKVRYRWRLHGQMSLYSRYWQDTLALLAKGRSDSRFVQNTQQSRPLPGRLGKVCVLSEQDSLELKWFDQAITLHRDAFNPHRRCALYWPQQAGWQRFTLYDEHNKVLDSFDEYVFTANQWQIAQQHQRLSDTKAFIAAQKLKPQGDKPVRSKIEPVAGKWYWLLLTLFAAILWWEHKTARVNNES